jgi:hypothetical protein
MIKPVMENKRNRLKLVITAFLLIFVFGSVIAFVANESKKRNAKSNGIDVRAKQNDAESTLSKDTTKIRDSSKLKVIVYYFHGNMRCHTCINIEKYSHEAIIEAFENELDKGFLEWMVTNIDLPENAHYFTDYKLVTSSLVIAKMNNGIQTEWKNLNLIWELADNEEEFKKYVQKEVRDYF